jgi:predicted nucleic acid-binding protein
MNNMLKTRQEIISEFLDLLLQDSLLSENIKLINIDIKDKTDIVILSTALNGNYELFVTGDKELREIFYLKKFLLACGTQGSLAILGCETCVNTKDLNMAMNIY